MPDMCYSNIMNKSFGKKLVELYKGGKTLELLQFTYVIIFGVVTITAGLIALIKQAVGVAFMIVPLICLISFCMNLVVWSIIKTAIEHFFPEVLEKNTPKKTTKKATKKAANKTTKKSKK